MPAFLKNIPLTQIDEPRIMMRLAPDDDTIAELAADIAANGLVNPILVRPVGDRFRVVAGHRRLLAFWRLRRVEIPCLVEEMSDDEEISKEAAENLSRVDADPVDEAVFYARLINECGWSLEKVVEKARRSEGWVTDRLAIAEMPDWMKGLIRSKELKLGVALWLYQIENEKILYEWTMSGIRDGMTVRGARDAFYQWQQHDERQRNAPEGAAELDLSATPPRILIRCVACGEEDEQNNLRLVWAHKARCLFPEPLPAPAPARTPEGPAIPSSHG